MDGEEATRAGLRDRQTGGESCATVREGMRHDFLKQEGRTGEPDRPSYAD